MQDPITEYLNQIKKDLYCSHVSKQILLKGIHGQIREFIGVNTPCSLEQLYDELGDPKEVAIQLMESLDPEEMETVRNHCKKILFVSIFVVVFVVFVLFVLLHQANTLNPNAQEVVLTIYNGEHPQLPGSIENE